METAKLSSIFNTYNGLASSNVIVSKEKLNGYIPYNCPSNSLLGTIAGYVEKSKVNDKYIHSNCIAISTDGEGSHTYSYYIAHEFVPNSNVMVIKPKISMTSLELKIYASIISQNRYRYQYGRKPKGLRITEILIPTLQEIKNMILSKNISEGNNVTQSKIISTKIDLDAKLKEKFLIKDLFNVYSGGDKPESEDLINLNYVNSIENLTTNNGVNGKFSYNGKNIFSNFISVVSIGLGGKAFYQKEKSAIFTRVKALVPKNKTILNKYTAMYLITILGAEQYRYSYGRVVATEKLKNTSILLPVNENNEPDWQFIENYIQSLEYSSSL